MSRLSIKSAFREYHVDFVDDFSVALKKEIEAGGIVVVDKKVFELYRTKIESAGGVNPITIEANEKNKTIDGAKLLIEELVQKGIRRNQKVIVMGGGIIQDIAAFSASILFRGIEWVFFPTTLLAQADSCIGSKTSINLGDKKNLIGGFYPPSNIYIDTAFLGTLSEDEMKSGIGEMMHFYLYSDSPYFEKLIQNHASLLRNTKAVGKYIKESLSIKKSVAEKDEFDKGERHKFNYGHTFGHALESVTAYRVSHGQAVTVGMDLANFISWKIGLMKEEIWNDLHSKLRINFPNLKEEKINLELYLKALSKDKKNIGANIGCILAERPGKLIERQVPADEEFKNLLKTYFSGV